MAIALFLEVPGRTGAQHATAQRMLGASRQLGNLVPVGPPAAPTAAARIADAADGDPTWEDAEGQWAGQARRSHARDLPWPS